MSNPTAERRIPRPKRRTDLQVQADLADLDLYRVISRLDALADRIPVAGPKLRGITMKLGAARGLLRSLMHPYDRQETA